MIINSVNGKIYIGSSKNIKKRRSQHMDDLKAGVHGNVNLASDYATYGEKAFDFIIIDFCKPEERINKENALLAAHYDDGGLYNLNRQGGLQGADTQKRRSEAAFRRWKNPEHRKLQSEVQKKIIKKGKPFRVMGPNGIIYFGTNRARFNRENGLPYGYIGNLINGRQPEINGWRVIK